MMILKENIMLPVSGANVSKSALKKVPYVDLIPEDGRAISMLPFFDEIKQNFKVLVPQHDGGIAMISGKPVQGPYYAKSIVDKERDIHSQLIEYITLSLSFKSTSHILAGIQRDIINCSSVIEKYFILLNLFRSKKDLMIANLVLTDVEFLFANIRSLYDSMQVLIRDILKRADKTKRILPCSFNDIEKLETDKLKKYELSPSLREFYNVTKEFFIACRTIRVGFQHSRIDIPIIFCLDEGFALTKETNFLKDPIVKRFNIWPKEKIKENSLVSLLGLMTYLNKTVLEHMDLLAETLKLSISAFPPISNTFKVYFRGPHLRHLKLSGKYLNEQWIPSKKE